MIRSTKHVSGPLPGKLTNQSCKVRKCVLGQTSLVKTRQRWAVRNCQEHGIQLVPLETSDLCPSSSAKLSAQRSGAATQRSSKLCSATLSRCRSACKDWSSVKLTSEDLFVWHIPTSTIINHPHLIHHPSSWSSRFHHFQHALIASKSRSQVASKCKTWTPRGRWIIKSSNCWSLKCCNPAKDSCTSLGARLHYSNLNLVMPICMAPSTFESQHASQVFPSASHGIALGSNLISEGWITAYSTNCSLMYRKLMTYNDMIIMIAGIWNIFFLSWARPQSAGIHRPPRQPPHRTGAVGAGVVPNGHTSWRGRSAMPGLGSLLGSDRIPQPTAMRSVDVARRYCQGCGSCPLVGWHVRCKCQQTDHAGEFQSER